MTRSPALTPELLDDLVERIVEAVHPRRIILFGSGARGEMGPNSDLDLLVVMKDSTHRRRTEGRLYRELSGLGATSIEGGVPGVGDHLGPKILLA